MATETANQEQELQTQALAVQQRATAVVIRDQASYDQAVALLAEVKGFKSQWTSFWEPLREKAYSSYKGILDKLKEGTDPLDRAERQIKNAILTWDDQQRRIQEELQREAQRKAEEAEEARRAQLAFEMEESGATAEQIAEVVEAPITAVAAPVETYQKASGISRRENWVCEVTDLKKLAKAVGAGKVPVEYILPNMTALNARAKADRSTMDVPGCVAKDNPIIAGRTK